jgi:hypothetical protein
MMNNLEKALLIKELNGLIIQLNHRNMTLFETAKSKIRLREIFQQCEQPVFKHQQLAFKSITQPEVAAYEFARSTPYSYSFRGFFIYDEDLEVALYQQPETGWSLLHDPEKGWQIWLIPAPHRTALISDWASLPETQIWLEEQQEIYHCLTKDSELAAKAIMLQLEPDPATQRVTAEKQQHTQVNAEEYIQLAPWQDVKLALVDAPHAAFKKLYQLHLQGDDAELHHYLQIIGCYKKRTFDLDQSIYIAEQLNPQGQFAHYLAIVGCYDLEHAVDLLETYNQATAYVSNSVKALAWHEFTQHAVSFSELFHTLENRPFIHAHEPPIQYIPAELIHTHKFLKFKERRAYTNTPLLLLREHKKIRVIHGEKRLELNPNELAYPFLLLNRDEGVNWRTIQTAIDQLDHPVDVMALYQSLTQEQVN